MKINEWIAPALLLTLKWSVFMLVYLQRSDICVSFRRRRGRRFWQSLIWAATWSTRSTSTESTSPRSSASEGTWPGSATRTSWSTKRSPRTGTDLHSHTHTVYFCSEDCVLVAFCYKAHCIFSVRSNQVVHDVKYKLYELVGSDSLLFMVIMLISLDSFGC